MHVVATAGHVDHGKSSLVRALTGMEPDRWEEERRRGLTLDLGFAWTRLPSGGEPIAFVDVPGHERLVGNMLAGVGPVPAVLLVVAADQGWQPQSEEHLAVLHALGVRHGVLAVSRCDLADAETVRAARKDALDRIAGTSLGDVEAVEVSAATGAGLDALRAALARLVRSLPAPDPAADVRLWVDRAFTVRGRGTVVTGTLAAGTIRTGDRLALAVDQGPADGPDGPSRGGRAARPDRSAAGRFGDDTVVRVRGLQTLKEDRDALSAVARVAVNVYGPAAATLRRGDALLTPGRWAATDLADVRLHGDPSSELPLQLTLHVGSASVTAAVRPLGDDTARLSLASPLPLRTGDTALLRDPGRHRIAAGVTVLDVRPPRLARRGAAAARARELASVTGVPDAAAELRRRGLMRRADLIAMGVPVTAEPVAGDWLADPGHWTALRRRLAQVVADHAARHPMDPGLPTEAARRALGLPDRTLVDALASSAAADGAAEADADRPEAEGPGGDAAVPGFPLLRRGGRIFGGSARPELPPGVRAAVDAVRRELEHAPYRAPEGNRLAELGLTPNLLAAAAAAGALLRIADGIVLLPGADARAATALARLEQPFTTSEARRALDTTRRVAVPLLEHLDRRGYTTRLDTTHRRCRTPAPTAP